MFLLWSIVIIEERLRSKYIWLFIGKTMQIILLLEPCYFISQNRPVSRSVFVDG